MSITHSTGLSRSINCAVVRATFIFSLLAFTLLVILGLLYSSSVAISAVIYGFSLVLCSLCSYVYSTRTDVEGRRIWRHLDHAAIFLLIAGTYTPFAINIMGPLGIKFVYIIWFFALLGVSLRLIIRRGYERLFVGLYILIGWLFVIVLPDVMKTIHTVSLTLLGAGAIAYSVGALIFARDIGRWTDPVWHGFVLLASYLHFLAVIELVIP
jgi:hemolysin III